MVLYVTILRRHCPRSAFALIARSELSFSSGLSFLRFGCPSFMCAPSFPVPAPYELPLTGEAFGGKGTSDYYHLICRRASSSLFLDPRVDSTASDRSVVGRARAMVVALLAMGTRKSSFRRCMPYQSPTLSLPTKPVPYGARPSLPWKCCVLREEFDGEPW